MNGPQYTDCSAEVLPVAPYMVRQAGSSRLICDCRQQSAPSDTGLAESAGNARLIAAAINAFVVAGRRLGINPVELAERMAAGGLADLAEVVTFCLPRLHPHLTNASALAKVITAIGNVHGEQ